MDITKGLLFVVLQRQFSVKSNKKMQVIVNCSEFPNNDLNQYGKIKYVLPIIQSYVLEADEDKITAISALEGVVKVENDAYIMAQSEKVKDEINGSYFEDKSQLGEGIGVAVLDTGLFPHGDFLYPNRIVAFKDFINHKELPYDDNGHGTHVAGIIGADGYESKGKYAGIAPKVNLIGLKVLDDKGTGNISDVLAGLQWIFDNREKYNIKIINMSVGMEDINGEESVLIKAVETAWDFGFFVVCAAGNNGPEHFTITTPGISRNVITVGAYYSDDDFADELLKDFSSRGPTNNCIVKPEVIAPGANIVSCHTQKAYDGSYELESSELNGYIKKSGTSMATPIVSGIIARMLSDYNGITNVDFKIALKETCKEVFYDPYLEGWGLVDMKKLYQYFDKMNSK